MRDLNWNGSIARCETTIAAVMSWLAFWDSAQEKQFFEWSARRGESSGKATGSSFFRIFLRMCFSNVGSLTWWRNSSKSGGCHTPCCIPRLLQSLPTTGPIPSPRQMHQLPSSQRRAEHQNIGLCVGLKFMKTNIGMFISYPPGCLLYNTWLIVVISTSVSREG